MSHENPDVELERLYQEVLRGERSLDDVPQRVHRDAIRLALRLHRIAADGPSTAARARMRWRVLSNLQPKQASFADRMVATFTLLAAPTPVLVRALFGVLLLAGMAGGATLVSADSLPDDLLYGVKLAGEQVRLAIAITPEDKATVLLSMAEHRLLEAAALADDGRDDDALFAGTQYASALAGAAAELAAVPVTQSNAATLVKQLDARLAQQRTTAAAAAVRLGANPKTEQSGLILLTIASSTPPPVGDTNHAVRIATNAAAITDRLAAVAAGWAGQTPETSIATPLPTPFSTPARTAASATQAPPSASAGAVSAGAASATNLPATRTPERTPDRTPDRTPSATPRPSTPPSPGAAGVRPPTSSLSPAAIAALRAKLEAERAHQAAERAKQNAEHTATPRPTRSPQQSPR